MGGARSRRITSAPVPSAHGSGNRPMSAAATVIAFGRMHLTGAIVHGEMSRRDRIRSSRMCASTNASIAPASVAKHGCGSRHQPLEP